MFDLELAARTDPSPRPQNRHTGVMLHTLVAIENFAPHLYKQYVDFLQMHGQIEPLIETKRNPMSVKGLVMRNK